MYSVANSRNVAIVINVVICVNIMRKFNEICNGNEM
jgi:hypothetical protein